MSRTGAEPLASKAGTHTSKCATQVLLVIFFHSAGAYLNTSLPWDRLRQACTDRPRAPVLSEGRRRRSTRQPPLTPERFRITVSTGKYAIPHFAVKFKGSNSSSGIQNYLTPKSNFLSSEAVETVPALTRKWKWAPIVPSSSLENAFVDCSDPSYTRSTGIWLGIVRAVGGQ